MHGALDAAFLGAPPPCEAAALSGGSAPLASLPAARAAIAEAGGWAAVQAKLRAVHAIASKHGVSCQVVACRWLLDQGVTPIVPIVPGAAAGAALGYRGPPLAPPIAAALFQRETFLDESDMAALWACARSSADTTM